MKDFFAKIFQLFYHDRIVMQFYVNIRGKIEQMQGFVQAVVYATHKMIVLVEKLFVTTYNVDIIHLAQLLQYGAQRSIVKIQLSILIGSNPHFLAVHCHFDRTPYKSDVYILCIITTQIELCSQHFGLNSLGLYYKR